MRLEVYRVAYDEASAELSEILTKFEQLRLRKERVEKVVDALKPLVVSNETHLRAQAPIPERAPVPVERPAAVAETPVSIPVPVSAPVPVQTAPTLASVPVPTQQSVDEAADPFSRRVENVMGMSSAARDVREYSRLFNSGSSR